MAIPKLVLPNALEANYHDGDVDYITEFDPVFYEVTNRPQKNLAYRDRLLKDTDDTIIDAINDAAGNLASLRDYLRVVGNDDGEVFISTLSDVAISGIANNDLLQYNLAQHRWKNVPAALFPHAFADHTDTSAANIAAALNGANSPSSLNVFFTADDFPHSFSDHDDLNATDIANALTGSNSPSSLNVFFTTDDFPHSFAEHTDIAASDIADALNGAASPTSSNVFATMRDLVTSSLGAQYVLYVSDQFVTDYSIARYATFAEAVVAARDSTKRPAGWPDHGDAYTGSSVVYKIELCGKVTINAHYAMSDTNWNGIVIDTTHGYFSLTNTTGHLQIDIRLIWIGKGWEDVICGTPDPVYADSVRVSSGWFNSVGFTMPSNVATNIYVVHVPSGGSALPIDSPHFYKCTVWSEGTAATNKRGFYVASQAFMYGCVGRVRSGIGIHVHHESVVMDHCNGSCSWGTGADKIAECGILLEASLSRASNCIGEGGPFATGMTVSDGVASHCTGVNNAAITSVLTGPFAMVVGHSAAAVVNAICMNCTSHAPNYNDIESFHKYSDGERRYCEEYRNGDKLYDWHHA